MKTTGLALLIILLCSGLAVAQQVQVDLRLIVTNGASVRTLHFGLAPSAGDGQDILMGEIELPPAPPAGAFDVRFTTVHLGSDLQGQSADYRCGRLESSTATLYRLKFQPGDGTDAIAFTYDFPKGVTGRLSDRLGGIVVDHAMSARGTCTLANLALSELDMEIFWTGDRPATDRHAPLTFGLHPSYPNPFNPSTTMQYSVAATGHVLLRVFDVTGREVATLEEGIREPGRYSVVWDAADLAGGVYFYRLTAGGFTETRSVLLLK